MSRTRNRDGPRAFARVPMGQPNSKISSRGVRMETRKPKHHSMPMTCKDKLDRVFTGEIRQTIRQGRRYQVGDALTIFEWMGTPYRSKWGRRMDVIIVQAIPIFVDENGVRQIHDRVEYGPHTICSTTGAMSEWGSSVVLDMLADLDGLKPPTSVHLKEVLFKLHPDLDFEKGEVFQVVRW